MENQETYDQCKYNQMLEDLTVVIITRNRPEALRGIVKYWSKWPVSLLILDGSDIPINRESLEIGVARAKFYSAPNKGERFFFAASAIETSFACLHSDDDFTLARGAARAIEWLGNNPDYICVSSDVQLFDSKLSTRSAPPGKWITSDTPQARIMDHLSDYRFSYYYGIQRTSSLCAALKAVNAATSEPAFIANPNDSIGYELGLEICCAALGRLGNSPEVILLKQIGNESRDAESQTPSEWLADPRTQAAVRAWRSALSREMSALIGCNEKSFDEWIAQALNRYSEVVDEELKAKSFGMRLVRSIAMSVRPHVLFQTTQTPSRRKKVVRRLHFTIYFTLRLGFRALTQHLGLIKNLMTGDLNSTNADPLDLQDVNSLLKKGPR
jgi:glycosyltransferase domain-containing protein